MERSKLVEKLNKDVEDFIANLKPTEYKDGWPEDRWKEEMEKHPLFMSKPLEEGEDLPPLVEAFRQLKYDPEENSPFELAVAYKADGNQHYKMKKFRWAIESYTKGIEVGCEGNVINAHLYANRSSAQYNIGNFRKSLKDATEAKKLKPDHLKCYTRGAMCCLQLQEYNDAISWCNEGLQIAPEDRNLNELKRTAEDQKKIADRNRRKAMVLEAKKKKELEELKAAIKERGIVLADENLIQGENKPVHPALSNAKVHLKEDKLVWPVVFMYPEYGTTDYIQEFHEDSSFQDHLSVMFKADDPPDWDKNCQYVSDALQLYFSDNDFLVPVDKSKTLKQVLVNKRYRVHGGTPHFLVTVADSKFDKAYRKRNIVTT